MKEPLKAGDPNECAWCCFEITVGTPVEWDGNDGPFCSKECYRNWQLVEEEEDGA